MIHTIDWNFLFPIYQGQRPYLVAARTKPSTLIPIFVAGRASETAGMGSDLAEAPQIQLGGLWASWKSLWASWESLGSSWVSLITSKEGLRSSQVDLQSARKGLKSAVRASKPAERPRGRDRQTDKRTDGEEKKNDGKNCPWFYRSSSPTGSLSKNHERLRFSI